ncbi:MAG: C4-dicarboxylate ABC transporter permease [Desulfobacterales bacterium]|nr:MAG: C4-dicarboxylate ABC transporter permease [Desulfobacterales bacterium]
MVEVCLFLMGTVMVLTVGAQVFFRYGLNRSLFWSEELARLVLVWLTFLGASVAYYRRVHPSVDLLYDWLPPGGRRFCRFTVHLVSILFFAVITWYGIQFSWFVRLQITPALQLPKSVFFAAIPAAGLALLLHALCFLAEEIRTGEAKDECIHSGGMESTGLRESMESGASGKSEDKTG